MNPMLGVQGQEPGLGPGEGRRCPVGESEVAPAGGQAQGQGPTYSPLGLAGPPTPVSLLVG